MSEESKEYLFNNCSLQNCVIPGCERLPLNESPYCSTYHEKEDKLVKNRYSRKKGLFQYQGRWGPPWTSSNNSIINTVESWANLFSHPSSPEISFENHPEIDIPVMTTMNSELMCQSLLTNNNKAHNDVFVTNINTHIQEEYVPLTNPSSSSSSSSSSTSSIVSTHNPHSYSSISHPLASTSLKRKHEPSNMTSTTSSSVDVHTHTHTHKSSNPSSITNLPPIVVTPNSVLVNTPHHHDAPNHTSVPHTLTVVSKQPVDSTYNLEVTNSTTNKPSPKSSKPSKHGLTLREGRVSYAPLQLVNRPFKKQKQTTLSQTLFSATPHSENRQLLTLKKK